MSRSRFQKGSGCYRCSECGKSTRQTSEVADAASVRLCQKCYDAAGMENAHNDGRHDKKPHPDCPQCRKSESLVDRINEAVAEAPARSAYHALTAHIEKHATLSYSYKRGHRTGVFKNNKEAHEALVKHGFEKTHGSYNHKRSHKMFHHYSHPEGHHATLEGGLVDVYHKEHKLRESTDRKLVARWESRGKKHWLELYCSAVGTYGYSGDGCGGNLGNVTKKAAIAAAEKQVSYWPSAGKRVK